MARSEAYKGAPARPSRRGTASRIAPRMGVCEAYTCGDNRKSSPTATTTESSHCSYGTGFAGRAPRRRFGVDSGTAAAGSPMWGGIVIMGTLHLGHEAVVELDDDLLEHVFAVLVAKLRRNEPVLLRWEN